MTENKYKNHSFISRTFLTCAKPKADYVRTEIFPFFKVRDYAFGEEFTGTLKNKKATKMSHCKYVMFLKPYCVGHVI